MDPRGNPLYDDSLGYTPNGSPVSGLLTIIVGIALVALVVKVFQSQQRPALRSEKTLL
jgi:hypothetical protein